MTILGAIALTIVVAAIFAVTVGVFADIDWLAILGFGILLLTVIGTLGWLLISAWTEALS